MFTFLGYYSFEDITFLLLYATVPSGHVQMFTFQIIQYNNNTHSSLEAVIIMRPEAAELKNSKLFILPRLIFVRLLSII